MISFSNVFYEIAVILAIATAVGTLALWLRQPLIMAFIAVGILVGPAGLNLAHSTEQVELFAELGVALLLFVVGLRLDPQEISAVGSVAIIAGMAQILITGCLGYAIALALGLTIVSAGYVGITLAFSSTIIIVKLLSDKREIEALHGRIALGILIVQDLVVILVAIALAAFTNNSQPSNFGQATSIILVKGFSFLAFVAIVTRYLFPKLLHVLAGSVELLLVFAISWAIALAAVGDALGFSKEVGAFIAGVSLASTHYRATLGARLVSLRDFLLLFFFINLGIHLDVSHFGSQFVPALIFSLFVLIGKPLLTMVLVGMMGYRTYTSAIASFSLGQISEFSFILATLGVSLGHIPAEVMGLITFVGLMTMGLSTYAILYSHNLYEWLSPWLSWFEAILPHPKKQLGDLAEANIPPVDIILLGLGRYGGSTIRYLHQYGFAVLGVDFDPQLVKYWCKEGMLAFYGDVEDPEFIASLPLDRAKWIISTLPGERIGLTLLHALKHRHFPGKIALTSHSIREMEILKDAGADLVLLPFRDAAKEAADQLAQLELKTRC
ncbi:MAG: cation:proton antiporter [Hydrococcus sp. Prado102]|nr:cation:proton antiporter [Hydrococcus sp. Prado102]